MFLICLESNSEVMKFSYGIPDFGEQLISCSEFVFDFEFATALDLFIFRCQTVPQSCPTTSEGYRCEATHRLDAFMACSYSYAHMNPCVPGLCSSLCFWLILAVA